MEKKQFRQRVDRRREAIADSGKVFLTRGLRRVYSTVGAVQTKTRPSAYIPVEEMPDYRADGGLSYSVGFGKATLFPDDFMKHTYYLAYRGGAKAAVGYLDEPKAHAVWMDDRSGRGGILLVSLDAIGLLRADVQKIRESLSDFADTTGCRGIHVLCTGTHSGFYTLGVWNKRPLTGQDKSYKRFLISQVKQAAVAAYKDRRRGQIYLGSVHVPDLQCDKRTPLVFSDVLTRFRFVPNDGSREVWLVHFPMRPDALRGDNTRISADYPAYMRDAIRGRTGAETVFFLGPVGGGVCVRIPDEEEILAAGGDFARTTREAGEKLAAYAMFVENEKALPSCINILTQQFYLSVDNTVLMTAKLMRMLSAETFFREDTSMGVAVRSEMTYLTIGGRQILLVPGQLFPELVTGDYLSADASASGYGPEVNSEPLARIAGDEKLLVFGLADDHLGAVVPYNDFLLHPDTPYLSPAYDRHHRAHSEEQFSLGADTAHTIADTFEAMMDSVRRAEAKAAAQDQI